ncbi:MAG TPA: NAD-dependent succinate-semialdehyde dehydrogenase [Candidatus Acidoferrum sp.]|nr:NAD-dependent succinate-semialdehyde dehydrogenase [Candidatus Acidoferrum sp.]
MRITSINPTNDAEIASYDEHSEAEIHRRLEQAAAAFETWRRESFATRAQPLRHAAGVLRREKETLARLMALEMGKPLEQGRDEVERCAACCDFFAENAEGFLSKENIPTEAARSFVTFQPLGTLLAIMPWNFPFWQVFRAAAPALMAGNAVVLKHASNVFGCALAIERIFTEVQLPPGLFAALLVGSKRVESLIANPLVAAVTLTGSTSAGKSVASTAGAHLKKCVLELGGSDPYIVLADADLQQAADVCATSRLINSGQSCIAAKRFIVVREVRCEFQELFVTKMRERRMGDPLADGNQIGPQARRDLRDALHEQVTRSVASGAKRPLGGEVPSGPGAFYPATVLSNVKPGMAAFDEELFGPVAAIIEAADEHDAIRLANNTQFGLGAVVFTRDIERGERIAANELEAGCCFVNDFVKSDPRLPFGGIKESGFGRELSSFGIREFTNIKTVVVR